MIIEDNRFCRNCPHHRDSHLTTSYPSNYNLRRVCFAEHQTSLGYSMPCMCPKYMPLDNLEYLEVVYAKRSI